jgi:integrase
VQNGAVKLRYLSEERDRHGRRRVYVRRNGRRVPINDAPGSVEFAQSYARALATLQHSNAVQSVRGPARGTLGWLATTYFASAEFQALDRTSQRVRRGVIESCMVELYRGQAMRECPLSYLTAAKIKSLRDAKGDKRGAANNRLKYLSAMFGWAIEAGHAKANPVRDVRKLKKVTGGFHTWTVNEVAQFEAHHKIGSKARLALALLLFLGVRRGDVVQIAPKNIADNVLSIIVRKPRHLRVDVSHKPILPELAEIIAATPTGKTTLLETSYRKAFTPNGFGNWFRARCDEAGLPQCSAHGLRKAGATLAAEKGATVHQLMAIFDWRTTAQATPYTHAADRKRLAAQAMSLLGRR